MKHEDISYGQSVKYREHDLPFVNDEFDDC